MTLITRERTYKTIILFFCFIGLLLSMLVAYKSYKKFDELKTWEQATATIVYTSVKSHRGHRGRLTYCPDIKVLYLFEDYQYVSKLDIADGECWPILTAIRDKLREYPVGASVDIFVNPEKPGVIRDANYSLGVIFYGTLLLIVLFLFLIVYLFRNPLHRELKRTQERLSEEK